MMLVMPRFCKTRAWSRHWFRPHMRFSASSRISSQNPNIMSFPERTCRKTGNSFQVWKKNRGEVHWNCFSWKSSFRSTGFPPLRFSTCFNCLTTCDTATFWQRHNTALQLFDSKKLCDSMFFEFRWNQKKGFTFQTFPTGKFSSFFCGQLWDITAHPDFVDLQLWSEAVPTSTNTFGISMKCSQFMWLPSILVIDLAEYFETRVYSSACHPSLLGKKSIDWCMALHESGGGRGGNFQMKDFSMRLFFEKSHL